MDDDLESKARPLIQEFGEDDISDHNLPRKRPVIEEINERFTRLNNSSNKPGRPLIEELGPADEFEGNTENFKPSNTETSPDGAVAPHVDTAETKESSLNVEADCQSSLGPSWEMLQKLAEQVGSTIEREPLDIAKERKAFVKRMQDTNLGDLD